MLPTYDLRLNSSSGKLESTFQRFKKGRSPIAGWYRRIPPEQKRARQKLGLCRDEMRGEIICFVWLVPSRKAPQVFLTHRGRPKDSHDPQSASVCARRTRWGGIRRRQHDVVKTVPTLSLHTPVCLRIIHPSVGKMCLEICSVIRETELRDKPLLPSPPHAHFRQASGKWPAHNAL